MIHRICFDGHFSSIKTLVEKLRRCFQALPHLIYIIKYIRSSVFKMPILHRVLKNGQSKFLTMMKPKTHKKVKKKKNLFSIFALKLSRDSIIPPLLRGRKEKKIPRPPRGHRTRLVKERERERKKERKKDGRTARVVVVVQARGGGSLSKRE